MRAAAMVQTYGSVRTILVILGRWRDWLDRSHFWRLLDETPELIRRILTILSRRVRRLEQTIRAILQSPNPA